MKYYHFLGVDKFFLYTMGPRTELRTKVPHVWIDVSWVAHVDSARKKKKGMWYYGQYWTINDCLYRNKEMATDWVVFQVSVPLSPPSLYHLCSSSALTLSYPYRLTI